MANSQHPLGGLLFSYWFCWEMMATSRAVLAVIPAKVTPRTANESSGPAAKVRVCQHWSDSAPGHLPWPTAGEVIALMNLSLSAAALCQRGIIPLHLLLPGPAPSMHLGSVSPAVCSCCTCWSSSSAMVLQDVMRQASEGGGACRGRCDHPVFSSGCFWSW